MLSELNFPPQIEKDSGDVVRDFYLPCMRNASSYERLTGYFSSSVFIIVWAGLREFIASGGRMRLICSPALSERDASGLVAGYAAKDDAELARRLNSELHEMLADVRVRDTARALAALVVAGHIDIRIAFVAESAAPSTKRMFHDKVGVFSDDQANAVGFRGSMNETFLGLSPLGHIESIDVWPSWEGGRDLQRVTDAQERFSTLWRGEVPGVSVRALPDLTVAELRKTAGDADWEAVADAALAQATIDAADEECPNPPVVAGYPLRCHQLRAIEAWNANGRVGVLRHATGSGKTLTALFAISEAVNDGTVPLVLVPKQLLLRQWYEILRGAFPDFRVLRCGDGHDEWRTRGLLRAWLAAGRDEKRVFLAVLGTAVSPEFRSAFRNRNDVLVVADEVHAMGSPRNRSLFELPAGLRLGLSATPERYGDPDGTAALLDFFGGVVDSYGIQDAIRDRILTPYRYEPHIVELEQDEQERWDALTLQIRQRAAMAGGSEENLRNDERLKRLRIQRARVAKKARGKVALTVQVVRGLYQSSDRWLVYCEDQDQLAEVREALAAADVPTLEYHTSMTGDADSTMRRFELGGGVMVSIRCLDEGIDIPAATHALILASSKNPREFIQRRGRVLRKAIGKDVAHVHDALVVPHNASDPDVGDQLVLAELARAMEFAQWAINSAAATRPLDDLCLARGIDIDDLYGMGEEDDDD